MLDIHRVSLLFVIFITSPAIGQVVQQPVVDQFRVDTAVSVPDRGSALLGSVSTAREGTQSYGPLPWGTSTGREVSHSATRVHVYIHDFELLDQRLLLEAEQRLGLLGDRSSHNSRQVFAKEILGQRTGSLQGDSVSRKSKLPNQQQARRAKALEIMRKSR